MVFFFNFSFQKYLQNASLKFWYKKWGFLKLKNKERKHSSLCLRSSFLELSKFNLEKKFAQKEGYDNPLALAHRIEVSVKEFRVLCHRCKRLYGRC